MGVCVSLTLCFKRLVSAEEVTLRVKSGVTNPHAGL